MDKVLKRVEKFCILHTDSYNNANLDLVFSAKFYIVGKLCQKERTNHTLDSGLKFMALDLDLHQKMVFMF